MNKKIGLHVVSKPWRQLIVDNEKVVVLFKKHFLFCLVPEW